MRLCPAGRPWNSRATARCTQWLRGPSTKPRQAEGPEQISAVMQVSQTAPRPGNNEGPPHRANILGSNSATRQPGGPIPRSPHHTDGRSAKPHPLHYLRELSETGSRNHPSDVQLPFPVPRLAGNRGCWNCWRGRAPHRRAHAGTSLGRKPLHSGQGVGCSRAESRRSGNAVGAAICGQPSLRGMFQVQSSM